MVPNLGACHFAKFWVGRLDALQVRGSDALSRASGLRRKRCRKQSRPKSLQCGLVAENRKSAFGSWQQKGTSSRLAAPSDVGSNALLRANEDDQFVADVEMAAGHGSVALREDLVFSQPLISQRGAGYARIRTLSWLWRRWCARGVTALRSRRRIRVFDPGAARITCR